MLITEAVKEARYPGKYARRKVWADGVVVTSHVTEIPTSLTDQAAGIVCGTLYIEISGTQSPYCPSTADLSATDWEIVE